MSIERAVVIFTPAFAALAGWIVSSVGQLVPGVNLNKGDLTTLFVTGAVAGVSAVLKWLHGRQKITSDVVLDKMADAVVGRIRASGTAPAMSDIEATLAAHTDQIVEAINSAVKAPPTVGQVADEILQRAAGSGTSPGPSSPPLAA